MLPSELFYGNSQNHSYAESPQCTVCPVVWIRTLPTPLPQASVSSPQKTKGEGDVLACGWGSGGPNSDNWRKSLELCLLCALCRWYSRRTSVKNNSKAFTILYNLKLIPRYQGYGSNRLPASLIRKVAYSAYCRCYLLNYFKEIPRIIRTQSHQLCMSLVRRVGTPSIVNFGSRQLCELLMPSQWIPL